jgi:hypothetical protein
MTSDFRATVLLEDLLHGYITGYTRHGVYEGKPEYLNWYKDLQTYNKQLPPKKEDKER